jgi:hypothetical protein
MRKLTAVNDSIPIRKATGVAGAHQFREKSGYKYKTNSEAAIERPLLWAIPSRSRSTKRDAAGPACTHVARLPPLRCPFGVVHEFVCSRERTKQLK